MRSADGPTAGGAVLTAFALMDAEQPAVTCDMLRRRRTTSPTRRPAAEVVLRKARCRGWAALVHRRCAARHSSAVAGAAVPCVGARGGGAPPAEGRRKTCAHRPPGDRHATRGGVRPVRVQGGTTLVRGQLGG